MIRFHFSIEPSDYLMDFDLNERKLMICLGKLIQWCLMDNQIGKNVLLKILILSSIQRYFWMVNHLKYAEKPLPKKIKRIEP